MNNSTRRISDYLKGSQTQAQGQSMTQSQDQFMLTEVACRNDALFLLNQRYPAGLSNLSNKETVITDAIIDAAGFNVVFSDVWPMILSEVRGQLQSIRQGRAA